MRKPQGYATQTDRETGLILSEADTFTCSHCCKIQHVKPMCDPADLGAHCKLCDKLVCPKCAYLMSLGKPCVPFMERVAKLERHLDHGGNWIDPKDIA